MALNKANLKADILTIMNNHPTDYSTAASQWATAYDTYALGADDTTGDAPLSVDAAGMEAALLSSFNNYLTNTANQAANDWYNAMITYWTAGTFNILSWTNPLQATWTSETASSVTSPGTNPGAGGLFTVFADLSTTKTNDDKATEMSDAIDVFTKTVTVTVLGIGPIPPGNPVSLGPVNIT